MHTHFQRIVGIVIIGMIVGSSGLAEAQNKPIKLGQVTAISGESAESGKYQLQGAELAVEKINAAGGINGRKLSILVEDDQAPIPGPWQPCRSSLRIKRSP